MKIIDILNKIANNEELPSEIYFNGDYGELVNDNFITNYFMYSKNSKYEFYWLINHDLKNLNDEVTIKKQKVKEIKNVGFNSNK